jgi:hypothetical protein
MEVLTNGNIVVIEPIPKTNYDRYNFSLFEKTKNKGFKLV